MSLSTVATTQEHLDIFDIRDSLVVLKNGTACAVIQTTAVNFDLLSEIEQDAIIAAFSMLLNSITFPVQVVLRSKKLDISKYVEKIQRVESKISDPLLKHQAESYRRFVQDVIKTNEVLDKKFYVILPSLSTAEQQLNSGPFGWLSRLLRPESKKGAPSVNVDAVINKAETQILPKVDHITKEFHRLGIKTKRLSTQELVELFFDIYNPSAVHGQRIRTNVNDYKAAIVSPAILEE